MWKFIFVLLSLFFVAFIRSVTLFPWERGQGDRNLHFLQWLSVAEVLFIKKTTLRLRSATTSSYYYLFLYYNSPPQPSPKEREFRRGGLSLISFFFVRFFTIVQNDNALLLLLTFIACHFELVEKSHSSFFTF